MKKLKIFVMIILCIFMVSCDSNTQSVDSTEPYYSVNISRALNEDELPFDCDLEVGERYTQFIPDYDYLIRLAEKHFTTLQFEGAELLEEKVFNDNYILLTAYNDISRIKYDYYGLSIKKGKININYRFNSLLKPGGALVNYTFIKVPKSIFPKFFNHKWRHSFNFNFEFDDNPMYYLQYNYDYNDFINFPLEFEPMHYDILYGLLYTYNDFLDFASYHALNKYYIDETFFDNHFVIYSFNSEFSDYLYSNFSYSGNTIYLDSYSYYSDVDCDMTGVICLDVTFIPKSLLKEDFEYKYDYNFETTYKGSVKHGF